MPGLLDPDDAGATMPEPPQDLQAQLRAIGDPASAKSAMFLPPGSAMPADLPAGVQAYDHPSGAGTLITNDPAKGQTFVSGPLSDSAMADLLDYPQSKAEAAAGGDPRVVQAVGRQGGVVHEHAASKAALPAAMRAAKAMVPGGHVRSVTPQAAIRRRIAGLLG